MKSMLSFTACCLALLLLVGCGGVSDQPELGTVTGKVTLDGKPLAGVIINFQPESGRASTDETDADGNYDLEYVYQVSGAKVGKNNVNFAWPMGAEGKKALPGKYSGKTELNADVKAGRNKFDWELKSK